MIKMLENNIEGIYNLYKTVNMLEKEIHISGNERRNKRDKIDEL